MDRMDELLDAFLDTGEVPEDATPEERAELLRMAEAAGFLRASRDAVAAEATSAIPTARARLERFIVDARRPVPSPRTAAASERGGRRAFPRTIGLALAGVALLTVLALAINRLALTNVDTVAALEPGDFAQVEGVVTAADGEGDERTIYVASALGDIVVEASAETSVVDPTAAVDLQQVKPGTPIVIGGVVGEDRRIRAHTLAITDGESGIPIRSALRRLRSSDLALTGAVLAIGLSEDASTARVTIASREDRFYVFNVGAESIAALLEVDRPLGTLVRIHEAEDGQFSLELLDAGPGRPLPSPGPEITPPPGRPDRPEEPADDEKPALVGVDGIVVSGEAGRLMVLTLRGRVPVAVPPNARIVPAQSGLTEEQIREGAPLVGHTVAIRGGLDRATGAVIANVLVAGRQVERAR